MFNTNATRWLTILIAITVAVASVFADDVVKTKDGRSYSGEIVEQNKDYIMLKMKVGSIEQQIPIFLSDIETVTRDGQVIDVKDLGKPAAKEAQSADDAAESVKPKDAQQVSIKPSMSASGDDSKPIDLEATANKRVFVIPMEGEVGKGFRQDKLKEAIEAAEPYKPDVIVLVIDSPGGLLLELYKIKDYLQEVRDKYRIVVWIKSAISAAAMTSFNVREMYFMKEGHIGAATAWNPGTGQSLQGEGLQQWLDYARKMFESAGWSPYIAQAMIDNDYMLSADVETLPNGEKRVTWRDDADGEYVLSRKGENLVLDANQALQLGIANAICDDEHELAKALNLDGWIEVSDAGRKIMESWHNTLDRADKEIPRLQMRFGTIPAMTSDQCIVWKQQAQILRELIQWVKRLGDEVALYNYGLDEPSLDRQLRLILARLKGC